jgi:hypothetical protein
MGIEAKHAYRFGFLKSDRWQQLRLDCLARDGTKCRICKVRVLSNDAHHIRYPKNWFDTKIQDLVTLCREHHELVHKIMEERPGLNWKQIRFRIRIPGVHEIFTGRTYRRMHLEKAVATENYLTAFMAWVIHIQLRNRNRVSVASLSGT